ncbi:hypothetical protein BDW71DRAFT_200931 [Aspergillus fruticulosus]
MFSRQARPLLPVPSRRVTQKGTGRRPRATKNSIACAECRRPCIVDEDSDRRHKSTLERRLEALEHDRRLLHPLVSSLSDDNQLKASKTLSLTWSNASLDKTRQYLDRHAKHAHKREQEASISHPVQTWINRNLFIRDMQAGKTDCYFCSPFLVKASYSKLPGTKTPTGTIFPGRQAFYREAKRLLDEELGRFSLTNFQGQCEMYTSFLPRIKAQRSSAIAKAKTDQKTQELVRALEIAASGHLQSFRNSSDAFPIIHQPSILPPGISRRPLEIHGDSELWHPYPVALEPLPAHANYVANKIVELQMILWEISLANSFYSRLQHLRYHSAIITICNLVEPRYPLSKDRPTSLPSMSCRITKANRLSSIRRVCSLLQTFIQRWSEIYMPVTFIGYANLALLTLLKNLENPESTAPFGVHEQAAQAHIALPKEIISLS